MLDEAKYPIDNTEIERIVVDSGLGDQLVVMD